MSYANTLEYKIVPTETYKIRKMCAGCGCKQIFKNKECFRVNANGNKLDVWMIYGCEKCGHTYNLPIYERIQPTKIPKEEYEKFLVNDAELIFQIGTNKTIFSANKAEILRNEIEYQLIDLTENKCEIDISKEQRINIKLENAYELSIREDKVVAFILGISRKEAKRLITENIVVVQSVTFNQKN